VRAQLSQLKQTRRNTVLCQPMPGLLTLCLLTLCLPALGLVTLGPAPGKAPV
jgi:hypothetical protein